MLAEAQRDGQRTVSDHFQPWRHEGGHAPFSLAWMTAVGERTERLIRGTSVLTPTFRYNPAVIAQAFATMACLYPDRVFLGVGTGEALNEIATGHRRMAEFKGAFRPVARIGAADARTVARGPGRLDGDYYHLKGASIYDVPEGACRSTSRGRSAVAGYAGRAGDGFICTSAGRGALHREADPAVREGAAAADRDVDDDRQDDRDQDLYDTDPELALENTWFWRRCR